MQIDNEILQLFLEEILADFKLASREKALIRSFCKTFKINSENYNEAYGLAKSEVEARGFQPGAFEPISFYLELGRILDGHAHEYSILLAVRQFLGLDYRVVEEANGLQNVYEKILKIYLIEVLTDSYWSPNETKCLSNLLSLLKISRRRFLQIYDGIKAEKIAYRKTHFISDVALNNKIKPLLLEINQPQIYNSIKQIISTHFEQLPVVPIFSDSKELQVNLEDSSSDSSNLKACNEASSEVISPLRFKMGSHQQWLHFERLRSKPRRLSSSVKMQLLLHSHCALLFMICFSLILSLFPLGGMQLIEERILFGGQSDFTMGKVTEVRYSSDDGFGLAKISYWFEYNGESYVGQTFVEDLDGTYRSLDQTSVQVEFRLDDPFISRLDEITIQAPSQNFYDCCYLLLILFLILYCRFRTYEKYCSYLREGELSLAKVSRESGYSRKMSASVLAGGSVGITLNAIRFSDSLIIPNQKVLLFHSSNKTEDALVWEDLKDLIHFKDGEFRNASSKMKQELAYLVFVLPAVIFVAMHEIRTVLDAILTVISSVVYWL